MRRTILALLLVCLCLLTACSSAPQETTAPTASETTVPTETEPTETISPVAEEKEVIVYFANWYLDTKTAEEGAEVCSIPWDKVTCINHAFWAVEPADGSTETSWDRLAASGEPRTSFRVASTLPKADFDNDEPSRMAPDLPRNHFAQYQYYSEQSPDVKIRRLDQLRLFLRNGLHPRGPHLLRGELSGHSGGIPMGGRLRH